MRRQIILKVFLFLLFVGYFCAANMFSHIHILNGQTITHSHPHREGHAHNTKEYQFIQDLTHFSFLDDSIEISFQAVEIQLQKKESYYQNEYIHRNYRTYSGRSPPFIV